MRRRIPFTTVALVAASIVAVGPASAAVARPGSPSPARPRRVQLWDCNGSGAQVWTPRPDGSLRNPQSGKCLDDPNSSTDWGTQQQLFTCNGTGAQHWGLPG
ncbi:ricin-type beta-trefoil lectin domain protein [Dactylosporangium sp. NPDC000244]|uniref:ricin-type beta-trefoil lectin domain protein n=1 Tax=Dactylosporangium sp. NPDC000244 TaxID=3154365 RepID=UPI0033307AC9